MKFKFILMLLLSVLIALPAAAFTLAGDDVQLVQVDQDIGGDIIDLAAVADLGIKANDHALIGPNVATISPFHAINEIAHRGKTFNSGTHLHRMQNSRRCG